jgi:hypothetical protein
MVRTLTAEAYKLDMRVQVPSTREGRSQIGKVARLKILFSDRNASATCTSLSWKLQEVTSSYPNGISLQTGNPCKGLGSNPTLPPHVAPKKMLVRLVRT